MLPAAAIIIMTGIPSFAGCDTLGQPPAESVGADVPDVLLKAGYRPAADQQELKRLRTHIARQPPNDIEKQLAVSQLDLASGKTATAGARLRRIWDGNFPNVTRSQRAMAGRMLLRTLWSEDERMHEGLATQFDPFALRKAGTVEITPHREEILIVTRSVLEASRGDARASRLAYRAAALVWQAGYVEHGLDWMRYVADQFPNTESAKLAVNIILDDLIERREWDQVKGLIARHRLSTLESCGDLFINPKAVGAYRSLHSGADLVLRGSVNAGREQVLDGAQAYRSLALKLGPSAHGDVMLLLSARYLRRAGLSDVADQYEGLFMKRYPHSFYRRHHQLEVARRGRRGAYILAKHRCLHALHDGAPACVGDGLSGPQPRMFALGE